jgi:hypothetical protein
MLSKNQNEVILAETRYLVNLFLETNLSDLELEKKTGISSSSIQRRLTNKAKIMEAFKNGEEIYELVNKRRKANLKKGKIRGGLTSQLNNIYTKENTKLRLDLFFEYKNLELEFLRNLILVFRAKRKTIEELFNYTEEELNDIYEGNEMDYLENYDNTIQEFSKEEIITYYRDLLNSINSKEKNKISNEIKEINDYWIYELMDKISKSKPLNENDYNNLLNYQLKYALREHDIEKLFNIDKDIYFENVIKILDNNIILKNRYNNLKNYYLEKVRGVKGGHK